MKINCFKKMIAYGITLAMMASFAGCGTSLNGAVAKENKSGQSIQMTEQEATEQLSTDKYLDLAGATEADYSKYDKSSSGTQSSTANGAPVGNEKATSSAAKSGTATGNENGVTVDATKGSASGDDGGNTAEDKPNMNSSNTSSDSESEYTCTLTVTCATILDNRKNLAAGKEKLVPSDGIIYSNKKVTFSKGDTVFDVLQREMKANRIQMEFTSAPAYNCDYVEAIDNLYEFDCGQNSGWKYSVNGEFPSYGCSQYKLKDQDVIQWAYTCDLGKDLQNK